MTGIGNGETSELDIVGKLVMGKGVTGLSGDSIMSGFMEGPPNITVYQIKRRYTMAVFSMRW